MKRQDKYYRLSKKEHYRSRASYKLIQIDERFYIFKEGYSVLELGAAPGGWSQVVLEKIKESGVLIGVDLNPIHRLEPGIFITGDVMDNQLPDRIKELIMHRRNIEKFDVVISDMAPHTTGNKNIDHSRSIELAERVLFFSKSLLRENGHMVTKLFQGDMVRDYKKQAEKYFEFCKIYVPLATRQGSKEVYMICKRFKEL